MTSKRLIFAPLVLAIAALTATGVLAQQSGARPGVQPASTPVPAQRSAAAGATAPRAVEDPEAARRLFRELDRNGDGCLRADELWSERGRESNWAAADRNRDGCISPDEFRVVRPR